LLYCVISLETTDLAAEAFHLMAVFVNSETIKWNDAEPSQAALCPDIWACVAKCGL